MLKKVLWVVGSLWVVVITIGVGTWTVYARQQKVESTKFLNGFPWEPGWKDGYITPPFLTREQLVTRDNLQELADKSELTNLIYTYGFFHDGGNGAGIMSTFTKDAYIGGGYNDLGNKIVGDGCMTFGDDIWNAGVDSSGRVAPKGQKTVPRPWPGHSHNIITNLLIQVHGDTAELRAYYTRVLINVPGEAPVAELPHTAAVDHTGEYVFDARHTPDGWRFTRMWRVGDTKPNRDVVPRQCPLMPGDTSAAK
jgi:hypothetical protein